MANLAQNQNQFTQTPVLGQLTNDPQPATLTCQINPAGVALYVVGQPVVLLTNASNNQIIVDVPANNTVGPVLGVIAYSKQKNVYVAGDQVEIAARGNVIFLESSAAIVRGTYVSVTPSAVITNDPTIATDATVTHYILGAALGQASAASQLIRVMIAPGTITAAGVLSATAP